MDVYPCLDAFKAELQCLGEAPGSLRSIDGTFGMLLASGECTRYFNDMFVQNYSSPRFRDAASGSLVLHETPAYSLAFGIESSDKPFSSEIAGVPHEVLFGLVSGAGVEIDRYRRDAGDPAVFDMACTVALVERRSLVPGQYVYLDGRFDYVNMGYRSRFISLVATAKRPAKFVSEKFSAADGRAKYVTASATETTRLEYACEVLKHLGDEGSVPPLLRLCAHPAHFLRWRAVEALINVDFAAGRDVLRQFLSDEHPHVRASARTALDALGSKGGHDGLA